MCEGVYYRHIFGHIVKQSCCMVYFPSQIKKNRLYSEFLIIRLVFVSVVHSSNAAALTTLQVMPKRTNVPGMKQFRPGRFNPYLGGYRSRRPYAAPYFYSPYGYG